MTGAQYLRLRDKVRLYEKRLDQAWKRIKIPQIKNLRPATAKDIKFRAIIYHNNGVWHWHIVDEVVDPKNDFRAYVGDDGCHYGLHNAFVEKKK